MKTDTSNFRKFFGYVILLQAIVYAAMVFDVPFVRQVLGFVFFAFIPGLMLLKLLRINVSNIVETVLLSVGLSVSFLMILGFVTNALGSLQLIAEPLSLAPLALITNGVLTVMCILGFISKKEFMLVDIKELSTSKILTCFSLTLASIIGVLFIILFNNTALLISVLVVIPVVFVSVLFRSKLTSYYPLIILCIVLALLLSTSLSSNYVYGDDIQGEFGTFMLTKKASYWDTNIFSYYQQESDNSMMSITILPTALSTLLNIEPAWVFKVVFPLFFSLIPLGLYQLYRKYWSERIAFISTIFFVANYVFLTVILTNAKQMIGELFYVMLFLILLNKKAGAKTGDWILFAFAFFGLIVSHYSLNFIFLFLILFSFLGTKTFLKNASRSLNASIVAFASCLTFFWYIYVAQGPFEKFVGIVQTTFNSFAAELFSAASRGEDIQAAIGLVARPTPLHTFGTLLYDATIILILIGFVSLAIKFRKQKIDTEFFSLVTLNLILLISAVVIPRFAGFLELGRLYHILLMFLSPLFILGAEALFVSLPNLTRRKNLMPLNNGKKKGIWGLVLASLLLVAFFLFQTGLVYEVTGDPSPSSIALSGYRMKNSDFGFVHESDVFSATWLSTYGQIATLWTLADSVSLNHVLASYSTIDRSMILVLSNSTDMGIYVGTYNRYHNTFSADSNTTYIYLSQFCMAENRIPYYPQQNIYYNYSEVPILNNSQAFVNRIYTNGASEILYRVP